MENYSVLMSVYHKEKSQYLKKSIQSMLDQTVVTNNFVIVCDGKLNDQLDSVLNYYNSKYPEVFNIIRLAENRGQGNALNVGLTYCQNSLVARMDSDDIAFPNRCEIQLECFKTKGADIVSAGVKEFSNNTNNIKAIRCLPETHEEILEYAKTRNPFNHPCVMFRKEAVFKAGNYQDFYLYEDYYLWVRMLQHGVIAYNIQQPLLFMRAGKEMYKRRGGYEYFKSTKRFQKYLLDTHMIGYKKYLYNLSVRFFVQVLVPDCIREVFYKLFLRSRVIT